MPVRCDLPGWDMSPSGWKDQVGFCSWTGFFLPWGWVPGSCGWMAGCPPPMPGPDLPGSACLPWILLSCLPCHPTQVLTPHPPGLLPFPPYIPWVGWDPLTPAPPAHHPHLGFGSSFCGYPTLQVPYPHYAAPLHPITYPMPAASAPPAAGPVCGHLPGVQFPDYYATCSMDLPHPCAMTGSTFPTGSCGWTTCYYPLGFLPIPPTWLPSSRFSIVAPFLVNHHWLVHDAYLCCCLRNTGSVPLRDAERCNTHHRATRSTTRI